MAEELRTPRGFRIFADFSGSEVLYGAQDTISVHESSLALHGAHCWIQRGDHMVQLSVPDARKTIEGLQAFIAAAENDELTEPAEAEANQ